jgi:hypothetical protein
MLRVVPSQACRTLEGQFQTNREPFVGHTRKSIRQLNSVLPSKVE